MRDLLIKESWFPGVDRASEEEKMKLFYMIVKYGCLEEEVEELSEEDQKNWGLVNAWETAKGNIDRMKFAQEQQVEYGKKVGKKNNADPVLIWEYCQRHPKCKVNEIGEALQLPQTNASKGPYSYIYENEGWKNRKDSNWKENFSKIGMEKIPETEGKLEENGMELEMESEENVEKILNMF